MAELARTAAPSALWSRISPRARLALVSLGSVLAACGIGEILGFRVLLDAPDLLLGPSRVAWVLGALLLWVGSLACVEIASLSWLYALGARMELAARSALAQIAHRIEPSFQRTRGASDLLHRAHSVLYLRSFALVAATLVRSVALLALTSLALSIVDPMLAVVATGVVILMVGASFAMQPFLREAELSRRVLGGSLASVHLDAMQGRSAIRAHGAEHTMLAFHASIRRRWAAAALRSGWLSALLSGGISLASYGAVGWLIHAHLARGGDGGSTLLVFALVFSLPAAARDVAQLAALLPRYDGIAARLGEILDAPLLPEPASTRTPGSTEPDVSRGASVTFDSVCLRLQGRAVLRDVSLRVPSGAHVGIVGASGAGKSSLLSLLLGLARPSDGELRIDGELVTPGSVTELHRFMAWIAPEVRLWQDSLAENVLYGATSRAVDVLGSLDALGMTDLVETLPQGLATRVGAGGAGLSAGEAQRARVARGWSREPVRLAILDEPFRGVERSARLRLLDECRRRWATATLLVVSHDVGATRSLDHVVVLDDGCIVEQGAPADLLRDADGRYASLVRKEEENRVTIWDAPGWRRIRLESGALIPQESR